MIKKNDFIISNTQAKFSFLNLKIMKRRAQSAKPQRPNVVIGARPVQKGANRIIDSYWEEKKQRDHLKRV